MTRALGVVAVGACCLLCLPRSFAGSARSIKGTMTVSPTSVSTGSTNNFLFAFRAGKHGFAAGSQATLLVPAGWTGPQTNDNAGAGFVQVTPVLSGSTVSLDSIAGSGPWTLTFSFSTSQNQGGFNLNYGAATAPTNGGIYVFTATTTQSGGVPTRLRSSSPSITVNTPLKTNTTATVSSGLNPCTYGDWVTLTATVTGAGGGTLTGFVTFNEGDMVLGSVPLDAQGRATLSTNRLSVLDSPCWITAEYLGDQNFNPSVSAVLLETVAPVTLSLSGLAAQNRVYDGGTGAVLDSSQVSLGGGLAGDDVALDTSGAVAGFADANAGAQKTVSVAGLALQGADADNYVLGTIPTMLADILRAPLVVKANDTNRFFGAGNPVFTAAYSGFVAGESPSVLGGAPAFSTTANAASPVSGSPYPIVVTNGTLTADNYSFTFLPGWLTVVPAPGQPQRILSLSRLPNGAVGLVCGGAAGQTYLVEATSALGSGSWRTIATNTTDITGAMSCADPGATNQGSRFYRTRLP